MGLKRTVLIALLCLSALIAVCGYTPVVPAQQPQPASSVPTTYTRVGLENPIIVTKNSPTGEFSTVCVVKAYTGQYYLYTAPHNAPGGIYLYTASDPRGPWSFNRIVMTREIIQNGGIDHISSPYVVVDGGTFYCYFHASIDDHQETYLATSSNGVNWSLYGKVLSVGQPGSWDDQYVAYATVVKMNGKWFMYYEGTRDGAHVSIGLATSNDGKTWFKHQGNPIMTDILAPGPRTGSVLYDARLGVIYLVYGRDDVPRYSTYLARTMDGTNFARYPNAALRPASYQWAWDDVCAAGGFLFYDQGVYYLYYMGATQGSSQVNIGIAKGGES